MKRFTTLVIILLIALFFGGCSNMNLDNVSPNKQLANIAIQNLKEKYGVNFTATHVGNRVNYSNGTVFLTDNSGLELVAVVESSTYEVEDDYIRRVISEQCRNRIVEALSRYNIEAGVFAYIGCDDCSSETDVNIDLAKFKSIYNLSSVDVYICIDKDTNPNILIEAFKEAEKSLKVKIATDVYVLNDDMLVKCKNDINDYADINNTWFDDYSPISHTVFVVDGDNVQIDNNFNW